MDHGKSDFVYESPPLVEVIAEIRWKLMPLEIIPGSKSDPHFKSYGERLERSLKAAGFSYIETLKPDDLPIELLGHQVVRRHRKEKDQWPLYQYGPGIFTINIVPPYKGWNSFRPIIEKGLNYFYKSYPSPSEFLQIETVILRYIDAFGPKFGFTDYATFLQSGLRLKLDLPPKILASSVKGSGPIFETNIHIYLDVPPHSIGSIKISPGMSHGEQSAIVEFSAKSQDKYSPQTVGEIMTWLDASHLVLREWFHHFCSEDVRIRMGEKIPLDRTK